MMVLQSNLYSVTLYDDVLKSCISLQSNMSSGWGEVGDKGDKPGLNTWNVEVFITVIQDLVRKSTNFG